MRIRPAALAEAAVAGLLRADEHLVGRASPVPSGPLDPSEPPWAARLEQAWPAIRAELDALLADGVQLPDTDALMGGEQGAEGRWTTYVLAWWGEWLPGSCRRCPETARALRQVPDVQIAGFTVLGPRSRIPVHTGPARSYRWQMGLRVPGPPGACALQVGDEVIPWRERHTLAFDDRTPHAAWNDADEPRYVLFAQVPWPVGGWAGPLHRSAQRAFGRATRGVARRAEELDTVLNGPAPG